MEQEEQLQISRVHRLKSEVFSNYSISNVTSRGLQGEGFCSKYDPQNEYIGIVCNQGNKILYDIGEDRIALNIKCTEQIPATCIKWRPTTHTKVKVVGITNVDGHFQYWHVPSMKKIFTIQQKDNSLHCCDFSKSGQHFATAGKDANIRIYDENTKSINATLGCASWDNRGHSNRIFSIKFIDDNTIISGGWDSVVHFWDIRQGKSVKSFYGPHVAGDSIDVQDNSILIGCYAAKNQIRFYDLKKFEETQSITWLGDNKQQVAYVYTACFSPLNKGMFLAGSCGVNEVKLFKEQSTGKHSVVCRLHDLKHGCFSVDMSSKKNQFAFTTAHNGFYVYNFQNN